MVGPVTPLRKQVGGRRGNTDLVWYTRTAGHRLKAVRDKGAAGGPAAHGVVVRPRVRPRVTKATTVGREGHWDVRLQRSGPKP